MSERGGKHFDADDLRLFAPPGTVEVSLAALDMAREFLSLANGRIKGDWVAFFQWSHATITQPDGESREIGWTLGLGASKRSEVPGQMIHRRNGVEFVVHIPPEVLARSEKRLIDVDPTAFFELALR